MEKLELHYRHILEELGKSLEMLGAIFKKARQEIQNPSTLRRLIVDLIDTEDWFSLEADVKGDIYEGYFKVPPAQKVRANTSHPETIKRLSIVQPSPEDTVCDPAVERAAFFLPPTTMS
jgi:type I restriction enzyme M protein